MKKELSILFFNFFLYGIAESTSIPIEDPAPYRSKIINALPPQVQLFSDPKDGYIDTVFREKALLQESLGVPGEHCVIRKLGNSFLYKESQSKWLGVALGLTQESTYRLHFNFLNASRRSMRVNPLLPPDYALTHGVLLIYTSSNGLVHPIKLDQNMDVFDLRLGPRSSLQFTLEREDSCDAVEVLIYQSFMHTVDELMIKMSRLRRRSKDVSTAASDVD